LPQELLADVVNEALHRMNETHGSENKASGEESRLFLGVAISEFEGPWELSVIARSRFSMSDSGYASPPLWDFCQYTRCKRCEIDLQSAQKEGRCPLCGDDVYMT